MSPLVKIGGPAAVIGAVIALVSFQLGYTAGRGGSAPSTLTPIVERPVTAAPTVATPEVATPAPTTPVPMSPVVAAPLTTPPAPSTLATNPDFVGPPEAPTSPAPTPTPVAAIAPEILPPPAAGSDPCRCAKGLVWDDEQKVCATTSRENCPANLRSELVQACDGTVFGHPCHARAAGLKKWTPTVK